MAELENDWNLVCPKCGESDKIDVVASVWVRVKGGQTDSDESHDGSHDWDKSSACKCCNCDHHATVAEFWVEELTEMEVQPCGHDLTTANSQL